MIVWTDGDKRMVEALEPYHVKTFRDALGRSSDGYLRFAPGGVAFAVYRKIPVAKQGELPPTPAKAAHGPISMPPTAADRKKLPLASGVIDYFPDALLAVAACSFAGNEQHNPGKPLHWDRSKSGDESDALMRHFTARGTLDTDGIRHSAKVAWRALALLQKEIEAAHNS